MNGPQRGKVHARCGLLAKSPVGLTLDASPARPLRPAASEHRIKSEARREAPMTLPVADRPGHGHDLRHAPSPWSSWRSSGPRRTRLRPRAKVIAFWAGSATIARLCSISICSCSRPRRAPARPATGGIPTPSGWGSSASAASGRPREYPGSPARHALLPRHQRRDGTRSYAFCARRGRRAVQHEPQSPANFRSPCGVTRCGPSVTGAVRPLFVIRRSNGRAVY